MPCFENNEKSHDLGNDYCKAARENCLISYLPVKIFLIKVNMQFIAFFAI
jgi:hypothetical protein